MVIGMYVGVVDLADGSSGRGDLGKPCSNVLCYNAGAMPPSMQFRKQV